MKLQASEIPLSKSQTRRKTPKFIHIIAPTFLLTILPIYYPFYHNTFSLSSQIGYQHTLISTSPPKANNPIWRRSHIHGGEKRLEKPPPLPAAANQTADQHIEPRRNSTIRSNKKCDLFNGEWIPNPEGPYYTNETCSSIQEHQNCMKFGRPDTGYLKWRWKPDDCELPVFDPYKFLEMVRGKSIVFVGDSVARNHMQSLICLLSRTRTGSINTKTTTFSSPYLIRTQKTEPNDFTRPYRLYLDQTWTSKLEEFDYVIISAGQWFFRPSYFYLNRTLAGCLYCTETDNTHLPLSFSYRWAFRTAFRAINAAKMFRGMAFLRTLAPSHFEGGPWDKGGECARKRPFRRNETALEDYSMEMYRIQQEEVGTAQKAGNGTGGKFKVFDATKPMMLRPDGHPSKYGRWPVANQTFPNDCVHWCLPGPIDTWNDFLQELLKRELEELQ